MSRLAKWWRANRPKWWRGSAPTMDAAPPRSREPPRLTDDGLRELLEMVKDREASQMLTPIPMPPPVESPFKQAPVPKWAKDSSPTMAMDYGLEGPGGLGMGSEIGWNTGIGWLGFPFLAELSQRPEYRTAFETRAQEMTRKWIEFGYTGEDTTKGAESPSAKKIAELTKAMEDHKLRDHFRMVVEHDGEFGGGHLFIDANESFDNPEELRTALVMDKAKIPKGGKLAFRVVEPTWVYPLVYNSSNPLAPDYFKPQTWSVNGRTVHRSRLLTFVAREVPDILKPAYSFRGLSLSQLQMPYVNNWLRTRQSVSDIIHSFTVFVLKTVMAQVLDAGAMKSLIARAVAFNLLRDNKGLFVADKETEDFENVSAPLAGLHELQAQSQEQMAAIVKTPLVKLLGIQPSGLNASSEGEIRVYYDTTHAEQENLLREHLTTCLNALQLNLWGAIDEAITFEFVSLWELDEAAAAAVQKTQTDTDVENVNAGIIAPEEVRERLARDPKSQYQGLDLSGPPPEIDDEEDDPSILADPAKTAEPKKTEMSGDAAFSETDHPRDEDGKFAFGGGGGGAGRSLTPKERGYLSSYSGDDFLRVNTLLRDGKASDPAVAKIESALAKGRVSSSKPLYRAISRDDAVRMFGTRDLKAGMTGTEKGFASTTTNRNIAEMLGFGGVVLNISPHSGQEGLDMSQVTSNPHEDEVLLQRNTKMEITSLVAPKSVGRPVVINVKTVPQ